MNQAGKQSANVGEGINKRSVHGFLYSNQLAVMNLLLCRSRRRQNLLQVYFLCLEKLFRRKASLENVGYIHAQVLLLLLGLMAYVMFNDIVKLI
jgi:hypothetical protein